MIWAGQKKKYNGRGIQLVIILDDILINGKDRTNKLILLSKGMIMPEVNHAKNQSIFVSQGWETERYVINLLR